MAASPAIRLAGFVARLSEPEGRPHATFTVRRAAAGGYLLERRLAGPGVARCELGCQTFGPFADASAAIAFTADAVRGFCERNPEFDVTVNSAVHPDLFEAA